ncbi:MAG TPA: hypothetical protein VFH08_01700 [Chitinophagaceae bacterium]|nr:hypothetical protein [Chitinophagaceae bacterium]
MKKQILILAALIPIMFFSCIKKDVIKKNESLSIIGEVKRSTTGSQVVYKIPVADYRHTVSSSSNNSWKTYLLPD